MKIYVADSNFFIQPHRDTYPLDVAVSFWAKVKQLADEGKIVSIDKVKKEIYGKNDELEKWCKANLPRDFFRDTSTDDVMAEYKKVTSWAKLKEQYKETAVSEFLHADEADAFLVAFALADIRNRIVLTLEVSSPDSRRKVKLPDVCEAHGVSYVNLVKMFRELGETF